ncbi:FAD binding domain-containing protein [Spirochaetota bacterium]
MHLPQFQYSAPKTSDEVEALLAEQKDKAKILAGGTDLIVQMKEKAHRPEFIIDITGIESLSKINYDNGKGCTIGSATKIENIEKTDVIKEKYAALSKGASVIGSTQIRAMATIGGNTCNASPCADTVSPLVVFGAKVNITSKNGKRDVLLEKFIKNNGVTDLNPDEFVESFTLEEPWPNSGSAYEYMGLRNAMEIDMVNFAANIAMDGDKIKDIRLAMGSVSPVPLRGTKAEEMLKGQVPTDELIEKAAKACSDASIPIDDIRASADYRREIVGVLAKRVIKKALASIKK